MALPSFLLGAFAPSIKEDVGFGDAGLGAVFTIGFLVSAVILQFSGAAADRSGPQRVIRMGLVLAAIGAVALGTLVTSLVMLVVAFSLNRAAEAVVQPATNTLVSEAVPARQRGRAMGIKQSAIPLSTALAGVAVPVLGGWIGWQGVFLIVAALAIPAWMAVPPTSAPHAAGAQSRAELWRARHLQVIALGAAFSAAGVVTVSGFLTTAAKEAGFSEGAAGLLLTLGGLVMIVSRLVWGALADRFAFDRFVAVGGAVAVGGLAYLAFATESKPWIVVGTALVFGVGWSWPGLMILGVIERHPNEPGAASAVVQTAVRVGALVSPITFGLIADSAGFRAAWVLPFACALVGATLLVAGSRVAQPVPA